MKNKFEKLIAHVREQVRDKPLEAAALEHFTRTESINLVKNTACFAGCTQATLGLTFLRAADPAASVFSASVLSCRCYCQFPAFGEGEAKEGLNVPLNRPFFCSQAVTETEEA